MRVRNQRIKSYRVKWLIVLEEEMENKENVISDLENLIPEGTQVILLVLSSANATKAYSSVLSQDGVIRFKPSGTPRTDDPRKILRIPEKQEFYSNLQGRQLIVGVINVWPFMQLGKQLDDGSYEVSGLEAEVVYALAEVLNFT
ncbi:hypothetical protein SK128_027075, partial [Halocaridina rubra]